MGTKFTLQDVFTTPGCLNASPKPSISFVGSPSYNKAPIISILPLYSPAKSMGRRAKNKQAPPGPLPDATNKPDKRPTKRKAEEELERSRKKPKQEMKAQSKPVKAEKMVRLPAKKQKESSKKGKAKELTPEESDKDEWEGVPDVPDLTTSKRFVHFVHCLMGVDPSIVGLFLPKASKARVGRVWKTWTRTMNSTKKRKKCAHSFSRLHPYFVVLRSSKITRADDLLQASWVDGTLYEEVLIFRKRDTKYRIWNYHRRTKKTKATRLMHLALPRTKTTCR